MALMRWEPLSELERMRHQMDRVFENVLGHRLPRFTAEGAETFLPTVEVYQTDKDVIVNAELPGLEPKDVNVEISEDSITLKGETCCSTEVKEDTYFRTERQYGRFERVIPLPDRIKDQEAKATFKNGMLTVRAPLLVESTRPRSHKIEILTE